MALWRSNQGGKEKPDFSALSEVFSLEEKDAIDRLYEDLNLEYVPMDRSHVSGILAGVWVEDLDGLEEFPLDSSKKNQLERGLVEFATILRERHGYTVNVDVALGLLWNLKKAEFLSGDEITAKYCTDAKPVIFVADGGGNGVMLAPRITGE